MFEMSQLMIIVSFFMMLVNIFRCFDYFYLNKDVMLANEGPYHVFTVMMMVLSSGVAVFFCVVFSMKIQEPLTGWVIFGIAVLYTLALIWVFGELNAMKQRAMDILEVVVGVIEASDQNLDGHSLHVRDLSLLIYNYLPSHYKNQVNPENLKYAAILLDIGKLGVPGNILDKAGKLQGQEWEMMKRHPEISVKVLEPVHSLDAISKWILYHHERVDGTGYHHLKGEEIPLASRIMAVADTYSALTMPRSYKASLSYDDAVAELKMVAGTQLDAAIVDIFREIPQSTVEACMENVKARMKRYGSESFRRSDY